MANDEPQPPQESGPEERQRGSQLSQHIRPKIQRKSPSKTKKKDENNDTSVAITADEVEETRKRMESWMGLGSNSRKYTNNKQKTEEKACCANESTKKNREGKCCTNESMRNKVDDAKGLDHKPKYRPQNKPVSILKSPKYSRVNQAVAVECVVTSSANNITSSIIVGESAPQRGIPSKAQLPSIHQQQRSTKIVEDFNNVGENVVKSGNARKYAGSAICKDIVVERDPTIAAKKMKPFRRTNTSKDHISTAQHSLNNSAANYASIEGYVPSSSSVLETPVSVRHEVTKGGKDNLSESSPNNKASSSGDDEEPLVIDSLEGLMRAAGEMLPENPNKITDDTKVVEANISFAVMTQDQYEDKLPAMKEEQEEERKRQSEVFMGKRDIFEGDDDESIEGAVSNDGMGIEDDDDGEDEDAIMELLLGSDIDTDEDDNVSLDRQPEVRAFTLIWDALTNWMTHETVVWVKALRDSHLKESTQANNINVSKTIDTEWTPMVDRSDIGASRCAGVLAMLRLYLGKCMEELGYPLESRRKAEKRLNDFMRTFDYSRENPKLAAKHWKAVACILLDVVMVETREADSALIQIPPSVANVGMSKEEFEYLSRRAVLVFE